MWSLLPRNANTLQGYMCQRIIFLMIFQVLKCRSLFSSTVGETVNQFRNRINKSNVSFLPFILMTKATIVLSKLQSIQNHLDFESTMAGKEDKTHHVSESTVVSIQKKTLKIYCIFDLIKKIHTKGDAPVKMKTVKSTIDCSNVLL